ncbi:MAG: hypothetical protein LUH55_05340 [Bacteroides thetaiotaomicron]|nr:hypothetical protein [Bacteroides thetaiotaomicron]
MRQREDNLKSRAEQSRAEQSRAEQSRVLWLDSIKGILIFLTVVGHIIGGSPSQQVNIFGIAHYLIYCVHMPMFMLISGYLSKHPASVRKVLRNYIIPYVLFDLLYVIYGLMRGSLTIDALNILIPSFLYWYILALGLMRMLASSRIKNEYILVISIFLTLLSPLIEEEMWRFLSIGRVGLLWLAFYVGLKCDISRMMSIRINKKAAIFVGTCSVVIELLLLFTGIVDVTWATHDYPNTIAESLLKYLFMVCTIGCFVGIGAVIPENCDIINRWGKNSILIYLFHPYFVDAFKIVTSKIGLEWNLIMFFGGLIFAILTCQLLSMKIWRNIYDRAIQKISSIFKLE